MTDSEIIKALECCAITAKCRQECIFHKYGEEYDVQNCTTHLAQATLELVNRLQAEIERLKADVRFSVYLGYETTNQIKAEAIKEFAEKLKKKYKPYVILGSEVAEIEIDNLLKELAGENNETKTF